MPATARVKVTLEIELTQPWNDDCTIQQVYDHARKQAEETLRTKMSDVGFRVLESDVLVVLYPERKR